MQTTTKRRVKHTPQTRCLNKACPDCFLSDGQSIDTWGMDSISRLVGLRAPRATSPTQVLKDIRAIVLASGRTPERHP